MSPVLKELILSVWALSSLCNNSPKTTASNTTALAVRTSTDEFERGASIHPQALRSHDDSGMLFNLSVPHSSPASGDTQGWGSATGHQVLRSGSTKGNPDTERLWAERLKS